MPDLRIGTSSFTAAGWPGTYYPVGMQARDFLTYHATLNKLEISRSRYVPVGRNFAVFCVFGVSENQ